MKTLIIYYSKHGSTQKVVSYLQEHLSCDTINILTTPVPSIVDYDLIILGGSIYYGSIHPKLTQYIESQLNTLLTKKIGLFLLCMMSEETAAEQFNHNFNQALLNHSLADGFFGGVLEKSTLNPIEKLVTSFTFKNVITNDGLYYDEVDRFIEALSSNEAQMNS